MLDVVDDWCHPGPEAECLRYKDALDETVLSVGENATTFVYGQHEGKALACMFARNR